MSNHPHAHRFGIDNSVFIWIVQHTKYSNQWWEQCMAMFSHIYPWIFVAYIHFEFKLHQISINFESYSIPFVIYWKTSKQLLFMPCNLPESYLDFYLCDRESLKSSDLSSWNNILGMHPLGVLIIRVRDDWHIVAINSIDTCAFVLF